jgi:hypothetical protein
MGITGEITLLAGGYSRGSTRGYGNGGNYRSWSNEKPNWGQNNALPQNKPEIPMPPSSQSLNSFVNGQQIYHKTGPLCLGCGKIGHLEPGCPNSALALGEQSYLRSIVFGERDPQSYFTALLDHPDVLEYDNRHPQESTSEDSSSPPEPTLSLADFTNSFQSLAHSSETSSTSSHSLLLLNNSQHYLYQENHPSPYQQSRKAAKPKSKWRDPLERDIG